MSFFTTTIDENQCIGDSLETLNSNFSALDTAVYGLLTTPVVAFTCERNGTGTQNQFMAHGNGATLHNGICMPFGGVVVSAALQVYGMTGTVAVDPCIDGAPQEDYRLSTTGTDLTGSHVRTFVEPPLSFSAGNTIGWKQTTVPSSANAYNVTFIVAFSGV